MGLKWLVFLNEPLNLIGMWFGEHQRANIKKRKKEKRRHMLKRDWIASFKYQ